MSKSTLNKVTKAVESCIDPDFIVKSVRKNLLKTPMTAGELSENLKCPVSHIKTAIKTIKQSGANLLSVPGGKFLLHDVLDRGGRLSLRSEDRGDGWTVFGIITDNHKCNKHHRQDVENAAYDQFERDGIKVVLNAGNWIDGEARFNKSELQVFGMDNQLDYWVDTTPVKPGITTYFVSGDDHEGWYAQRECINIGQYAQMRAEKSGRQDLKYLGHVEADIALRKGSHDTVMRLMHPGGGSSYAFSYAPQKLVEAMQGGEKPAVLIIGHYHKYDVCYPREVTVLSAGCAEDQTMFMRKNKIAAHVGFMEVAIQQDPYDGHIVRLRHEFFPFYDRGYYERNFG
jgi:hypothetical protein